MAIEGPMEEYIRTQWWLLFINPKQIGDGIKAWVLYEFYAYMEIRKFDQVKVQGKVVDISSMVINTFYNFRVMSDDEYMAFTKLDYNLEEVMVELTGKSRHLLPNWINIQKKWLTSKARMLNLWMIVRLMPATSHSVVSKRQVFLLYAISKGLTINVGKVINEEMRAITNPKKKTQPIGFRR